MVKMILFIIIAIALFVSSFLKLIKKNDTSYLYEIIIEFIGIVIGFIHIFIKKEPTAVMYAFMVTLSIIIPIILIILKDKKGTDLNDFIQSLKIKFHPEDTKSILLAAIEKQPQNYKPHKKLAKYYEKNKEYEKAEDEYLQAINNNERDYESYYNLAKLLNENRKNDEAIELLKRMPAAEENSYTYKATVLLGNAYYDNEQFKEAISVFNDALKDHPSEYELYYYLGMTYTRLNDFVNAKDYYTKAATINSYKDLSNLSLGQINMIFKDYAEAKKCFFEEIACDDEKISAYAYYNLAKIAMIEDDKNQAVIYCNTAIETYPPIMTKIEKDEIFAIILGKLKTKGVIKEVVETKIKKRDEEIINYLENTYGVVEQLTDNDKYKEGIDLKRESINREREN